MITSYFQGRKQRVKVSNGKGDCSDATKSAPQGSCIGPFVYNMHLNDLLCLIMNVCGIFNHASDNSICCVDDNTDDVKNKLQMVIATMMKWFDTNFMKPNPSKIQFIVFDRVYKECFIKIN